MLLRLASLLAVFLSLGQLTLGEYARQGSLGGLLYLVNREHPLAEDYVPEDLVVPLCADGAGHILLKREAAGALDELFAAAAAAGHRLVTVSGYRSYQKQKGIFARKVAAVGRQRAQLSVAPPGTSEHQLGLAIDVGRRSNPRLNERFGQTPEGSWVAANAHRFGFIVRYRAEWTAVTGYSYEPWHLRYVGLEHAQRLKALDLPLESYVAQLRLALRAQTTSKEGT